MRSVFLTDIFTDTFVTVIGLIIFFGIFVLWFAWVYFRKDALKTYDLMAQLPLCDEGEIHEQ